MKQAKKTKKQLDKAFVESLLKALDNKQKKVEVQLYCSASGK